MDHLIVLGVGGDDVVLLLAQVVDGLLGVLQVVFFLLRYLLGLLLALTLMEGGETGLLTLELAADGLELALGGCALLVEDAS